VKFQWCASVERAMMVGVCLWGVSDGIVPRRHAFLIVEVSVCSGLKELNGDGVLGPLCEGQRLCG
jgi:hypothetical protein